MSLKEFIKIISPVAKLDEECAICQDDETADQSACALSCGHQFHILCLATWLAENETCPLCRKNVFSMTNETQTTEPTTYSVLVTILIFCSQWLLLIVALLGTYKVFVEPLSDLVLTVPGVAEVVVLVVSIVAIKKEEGSAQHRTPMLRIMIIIWKSCILMVAIMGLFKILNSSLLD